jgi:phage baseplate assembly protein V
MDIQTQLQRYVFRPLMRRISGMILRSIVLDVVDQANKLQSLKVQTGAEGEALSGVERVQNFGLSSNPPAGAQAVVLCRGGQGGAPLVIAVDMASSRPPAAAGETVLYNAHGIQIKLLASGVTEIGNGTTLPPTAGVVTGECIDPFTGAPHPDKSAFVRARKL